MHCRSIFTAALGLSLWACTPPESGGSGVQVPGDATMGDGGRFAAAGAEDPPWRAVEVCPTGAVTPGIDVSYWQGTIDWTAVATDVDFAFIRVSDGLNYFDTEFARNWSEAEANGVVRGAYQFFRPSLDPVAQADLLLSTMGPLQPGDLPPVIDVETSDGMSDQVVIDGIQDWIDRVEGELGVKPIIYTSWGLWSSLTGDTAQFTDYPLWVANWGVSCPSVPDVWGSWDFWQHTDSGSVSGIAGNVDENWFDGDLQALQDYLDIEPPAPCESVPAEGRIIEETESCFVAGGDPAYWYDLADGSGGSLLYTHTTDSAYVDNHGIWNLELDAGGDYLVEVYTAAPHAESQAAAYQVVHALGTDTVVLDQSAVDGWSSLGTWTFDAGAGAYVQLDDNTGEPWNGGETQIVFDALRLTPADPETGTTGTTTGTGTTGTTDTTTTDTSDDLTDIGDAPPTRTELQPGGCGCAATGAGAVGWPSLLALVALPAMRRRSG